MTRPRIGLALGSGSARGWAHIGVIDSLTEAGIQPDIVCGASMGALVGAAHVAGRLPELRQWAGTATWRTIARLTDLRLTGGGLISGRQVMSFLQEHGHRPADRELRPHYAAVATDMATGREIWLQSGPIHEAVRASIAIPGVLSPARLDDRWLVDGGLSNPIPGLGLPRARAPTSSSPSTSTASLSGAASPSRAAGRDQAVAPPGGSCAACWASCRPRCGARQPRPMQPAAARGAPGYFDVLATAHQHHAGPHHRARLAGEPPHVMLVPRLRNIGLMEFNRAEEAIAEGRACVEQALPTLRRYL